MTGRATRALAGLLAAMALFVPLPLRSASPGPFRLVLVTIDTARADHFGAYGYPLPTSPAFDALAASATVFTDVTCAMPTTLPSHLSIFTSERPSALDVTENGVVPRERFPSLFDVARRRGAATAGFVGSPILAARYLGGMGPDRVTAGDRAARGAKIPGASVTRAAERWLDLHAGGSFALWVHYYDAHEPYAPPAPEARLFRGRYDGPLGDSLSISWLLSLNSPKAPRLSEADRRHVAHLYDAGLRAADEQLAGLVGHLRRRGLLETTILVVVGDHGQALGDAAFWGHGEKLLEPVIKVPFLVRAPGRTRPRRVDTPVETLDLFPTICDLSGTPIPSGLQGRSLLPALDGRPIAPRLRIVERRSYATSDPGRRGIAIDGGAWKVVAYVDAGTPSFFLGRLHAPGGLDGTLRFEPRSDEAQASRDLVSCELRRRPPSQRPASEAVRMLRSLGYLQ